MGSCFSQLSYHDRLNIEAMLNKGCSKRAIADFVGCSVRTIYNEFNRGSYVHTNTDLTETVKYSAYLAQIRKHEMDSHKGRKLSLCPQMIEYIVECMKSLRWSVRALCGYGRVNDVNVTCYTSVYRYIALGLIPGISKNHVRKYKKSKSSYNYKVAKSGSIYPVITSRPFLPSDRSSFGHWEIDTVVGSTKSSDRSCLLVLTERMTRYEVIRKLPDKSAGSVVAALRDLSSLPHARILFKSITCDNGTEFSDYKSMSSFTSVYYCHPYSSWERGSNENNNKLIRILYPKGCTFGSCSGSDILDLQDYLNTYPRSIFAFDSSAGRFYDQLLASGLDPSVVLKHIA